MAVRTDLAVEEHALWERSAGEQTALPGVQASRRDVRGVGVHTVKILDDEGARQLHKPVGTYLTLETDPLRRREPSGFSRTVRVMSAELGKFLDRDKRTLVVGLGNAAVTPDAVGPLALRSLIVTRHLPVLTQHGSFCSVSALEPGVLGTTGMESAETVRAVVDATQPEQIVVIDALAAADPARICASIQLTDTGIVPGSGVGNSRAAFNCETLGAPVVAIGVPTVVDAQTLLPEGQTCAPGMIVTPRDIDARVRETAQVIGYALDLALHRGLRLEDVACFLA